MSNKVRVEFAGYKAADYPDRCFNEAQCKELLIRKLEARGTSSSRLGPQVGSLPEKVDSSAIISDIQVYLNKTYAGEKPESEPIHVLPPVESRACVPSLPSYEYWKRNHGISMNPYQISRKEGFWRITRFGERHTKYLEGFSSFGSQSKYLGWTDLAYGGSFGDHWVPEYRVIIDLDYWKLSSSHNGLLLAKNVIVDRTDPDLTDLVYTKLLAEAAKADVDVSTELAELGEALETLKALLPNLLENMGRLRKLAAKIPGYWFSKAGRRKLRQLIREGKTIPDLLAEYWLLYRYGILPAYYTVEDIKKALRRKSAQFVTERVGDQKDDFRVVSRLPTSTSVVEEQLYTTTVKTHGTWKARGLDLDAKRIQAWLPSTAWELVPFSFVVDWFVNVGEWIQSLRPISSTASKLCIGVKTNNTFSIVLKQDPTEVKTIVDRVDTRISNSLVVKMSGTYVQVRPKSVDTCYSETLTKFQRSVDNGNRIITTDVNLNLKRALDSLALLWQFVLR